MLKSYRAQDWEACEVHLLNLNRLCPQRPLYDFYAERVQRLRTSSPDPAWDGTTRFDTK